MIDKKCPHCGASLKMYWHKMTPLLAETLVKIYVAVCEKKENKIHPHREMKLTTVEHMNMTKLRFHGLIAKCKENGEVDRGFWLITKRGADFIKGQLAIPSGVQTFRNKVVDHKTELVKIRDVMGSDPYVESIHDFEFDYAGIEEPENPTSKSNDLPRDKNKQLYRYEIGPDNIARKVYL